MSKNKACDIRFMFDGTRVDEGDTPKSMDMEDGDTIEVFTQQSGGGEGGVEPPSSNQQGINLARGRRKADRWLM